MSGKYFPIENVLQFSFKLFFINPTSVKGCQTQWIHYTKLPFSLNDQLSWNLYTDHALPQCTLIFSQVFEKMLVTIHHHKNWTCYKTYHKASVHAFLTSLLDDSEWTHPQGESPSDTHWTGDYMGPTADLNAFKNRLISCLSWIKSQFLSQPACSLTTVKAKLSQIFTIKQIKFLK